jgi:hypothetical protein
VVVYVATAEAHRLHSVLSGTLVSTPSEQVATDFENAA